jgi:hypothetical protein
LLLVAHLVEALELMQQELALRFVEARKRLRV